MVEFAQRESVEEALARGQHRRAASESLGHHKIPVTSPFLWLAGSKTQSKEPKPLPEGIVISDCKALSEAKIVDLASGAGTVRYNTQIKTL